MTKYLPAVLVGLTALVTTVLVFAVYAVLWLFHSVSQVDGPAFDWRMASAVSGIATMVVLAMGWVVHRLVASKDGPPAPEQTAAQSTWMPSGGNSLR